jgi:hypothetical protein
VQRNTREEIEQAISAVQAAIGSAEQRYVQLEQIASRRCPGGLITHGLVLSMEVNRAIRRLLLARREKFLARLSDL